MHFNLSSAKCRPNLLMAAYVTVADKRVTLPKPESDKYLEIDVSIYKYQIDISIYMFICILCISQGPTCGRNEIYSDCMSPCEPTCENQDISMEELCTQTCISGCACAPGYIRDARRRCVLPMQCTCFHAGNYYQSRTQITMDYGCKEW